ncbi:MAG: PAAR domain-containing protein [Anaerolineae bacterium]
MGQPAVVMGDQVLATDIHIIMIPAPPGPPVPTPLPHPFVGKITQACSTNVTIGGKPAATKDSIAQNLPPHIPQGGPFQKPPSNMGKIMMGSTTVKINGKPAARVGDMVQTCADPTDMPGAQIIPSVTNVLIG